MLALTFGLLFVAFGVAGVRYADVLVEAQNTFEMTMFGAEELDEDERVTVTKGTAGFIVLIGLGLIAYGLV